MAPAVAASPRSRGIRGRREPPGARRSRRRCRARPGDRHYLSGGFPGLGWQYGSSLASACSHTARLPHGEVSGRHTDGVIELRFLPPRFTELGFTGFDLMTSRDQIRAVAQDVVPALRAPAQRPQPRRWPDSAPATLRPGPWPHLATAISPAGPAPEATRAASWPERPVRRPRTGEKVPVKVPRSRQRAPPARPRTTPMV